MSVANAPLTGESMTGGVALALIEMVNRITPAVSTVSRAGNSTRGRPDQIGMEILSRVAYCEMWIAAATRRQRTEP